MGNPIIDYLTSSSPILSLCPNEMLQVKLDFHLELNTLISLAQIPGTAYIVSDGIGISFHEKYEEVRRMYFRNNDTFWRGLSVG